MRPQFDLAFVFAFVTAGRFINGPLWDTEFTTLGTASVIVTVGLFINDSLWQTEFTSLGIAGIETSGT